MSEPLRQRITAAAACLAAAALTVTTSFPRLALAQGQLDLVSTNRQSAEFRGINILGFSPDGTQLATASLCSPFIRLWAVPDLAPLTPDDNTGGCGVPTSVAFSSDNGFFSFGTRAGVAVAVTLNPLLYIGNLSSDDDYAGNQVAFSPAPPHLVANAGSRSVQIRYAYGSPFFVFGPPVTLTNSHLGDLYSEATVLDVSRDGTILAVRTDSGDVKQFSALAKAFS